MATAGATTASEARARATARAGKLPFASSLAGKLIILVAIFLTVPVILYVQFRVADQDKQTLLLTSAQERGRLIAEVLRPMLLEAGPSVLPTLGPRLEALAKEDTKIKLLYRPSDGAAPSSFFYVASAPRVPIAFLKAEREQLMELGILNMLAASCEVELPVAMRYTTPAGGEEIISSVTPIHTPAGCWAVVTAHSTASYQRSSIGQPYWMTPEVRLAAVIYLAMALLTVTLFFGVWRSLRRFARLARNIRVRGADEQTFVSQNRIPEFEGVAAELDRLVETLEESSDMIRQAAEENAHAFKTPIAVISQSIEPLRRLVPAESERGRRAITLIERSVEKLDDLILCARRMDEIVADLIDPPRNEVDLSMLLRRVMGGYGEMFSGHNLVLRLEVDDGTTVRASEDLLETVIENLVENAVSFSPADATVTVRLRKTPLHARMTVEDQGPGVPAGDLERIFQRYYSQRRGAAGGEVGNDAVPPEGWEGPRHFGIGLWIVRRNVKAIGGAVHAENRTGGGLRVCLEIPLAR